MVYSFRDLSGDRRFNDEEAMNDAGFAMGRLANLAPSFPASLERAIQASRSAQEYAILKTLADPAQIHVGLRKSFARPRQRYWK